LVKFSKWFLGSVNTGLDNYYNLCYNIKNMSDIPSIKVLEAFKPDNAGKSVQG